mmetsp:Transcript_38867/g.43525  ORF Transcript_38867/g.43525 Transcript_38867/m.43525 type:complete len:106 (-) Transcript_38867:514-831(-)
MEFVNRIVGVEDVSLPRKNGPGFIREKLVNDHRLVTSFWVDPIDTDALLRGQGVDEACFTGKGISFKLCNFEECLVAVGMAIGVDRQESTEGTFLVEDGEDMSGV